MVVDMEDKAASKDLNNWVLVLVALLVPLCFRQVLFGGLQHIALPFTRHLVAFHHRCTGGVLL